MVAEQVRHVVGEWISERICEQIEDVHVPQVVKRTIEVPKMAEQILDVPVPEMVEQKLPETVSDDRIQQRTVEHITVIPVPQDVKELVEVSEVFPQDRSQQCFLEQINETPDVSLAEKVFERPVTQTQQGMNTHAQHIVNTVEVERPQIIKQTVQKPTTVQTDCSDEYRDPTVAGGGCPCCCGRTGSTGARRDEDSRDHTVAASRAGFTRACRGKDS